MAFHWSSELNAWISISLISRNLWFLANWSFNVEHPIWCYFYVLFEIIFRAIHNLVEHLNQSSRRGPLFKSRSTLFKPENSSKTCTNSSIALELKPRKSSKSTTSSLRPLKSSGLILRLGRGSMPRDFVSWKLERFFKETRTWRLRVLDFKTETLSTSPDWPQTLSCRHRRRTHRLRFPAPYWERRPITRM